MTLNNTSAKSNNNATSNTLLNELERAITRFFYKRNDARLCTKEHPVACTRIGVQVPLWVWTHYGDSNENKTIEYNTSQYTASSSTTSTPLKERTELKKAVHLIEWFYRNNISPSDIAVLLPLHWKKTFRQELSIYLCKRKYGCTNTPLEQRNNGNNVNNTDNTCTNDNYAEEVQLPFIFAHHELHAMSLRSHGMHHYKIVLYLLGLLPCMREIHDGQRQEPFMVDALTRAQECFIICADAGLTAPMYAQIWPSWTKFVNKLADERPTIPSISNVAVSSTCNNNNKVDCTFHGLVGSMIPLCCSVHPLHHQLENGLAPIIATCPRYCLTHYDCKFNSVIKVNNNNSKEGSNEQYHVCTSLCHPRVTHNACPYSCESQLACGHKCLNLCSEKCNCYEVNEIPLLCSHEELIGVCIQQKESKMCTSNTNQNDDNNAEEEKEKKMKTQTNNVIKEASWGELIPVYRTVHHIFRGVCEDAHEPCCVSFSSHCTRCHGSMNVNCHEITIKLSEQESNDDAHAQETMLLCSLCKQRAKEIRAELLGEMLVHSERTRRALQHELRRSTHQHMKGASHGLFPVGTLVRIIDVTECMPPLDPDAFPSTIRFIDLEDESAVESLLNAHGTVMSLHVNVMDRSELQYLVRVANGSHVLVTDSGLQMIRPVTATTASNALINAQKRITGNTTGDAVNHGNTSSLLLLENKKSSERHEGTHNEQLQSKSMNVNDVDVNEDDERMKSAERLVGQTCYLFASVPCTSMESGVIVDKVVQVQDVDLTTPGNVIVECTLCMVFANHLHTTSTTKVNNITTNSNTYKRMREDETQRSEQSSNNVDNEMKQSRGTSSNNEEMELSITSPCESERRELGITFDGGVSEEKEGREYKIEVLPLTFSVAVDKLQSMQNVHLGKQVCVEEPEQQLCDAHDLELVSFMLTTMNLEFLPPEYTLSSKLMDVSNSYSLCGIVNAPLNLHNGLCGPLALLSISKETSSKTTNICRSNSVGIKNKEGTDKTQVSLFVVPYFSIRPDVLADAEAELDSKAQELFARRLSEAISLDTAKRKQQNNEKIYKMLQQLPRIEQTSSTQESNSFQDNDVKTHTEINHKHVAYSIPHPLPTEEEVASAKIRSQAMPKAILLRWLRVQDKLVAKKQERQLCEEVQEMQGKLERDKDASSKYIKELQREWQVFSKTLR